MQQVAVQDRVKVTIEGGVADVRLVRADKMNALDQPMFDALVATGKDLITRPGVRAVVVSGEGRAFCAGLDMGRFEKMADKPADGVMGVSNELRLGSRSHGIANAAQYVAMVWRDIPVPVIAAVHGVAFGGGFQLALGADIRFVTPDARMSVMEIKWGLVPDMAGVLLMRGLARDDVIRELTFSGRIFDGVEAQALGFATRVCADPREQALALAHEIAENAPLALLATRQTLRAGLVEAVTAALVHEHAEQSILRQTADYAEGVSSVFERRPAKFLGR